MTPAEAASRLAHDVGKYVARTARNLDGQALDAELLAMLVRDLYELGAARERASLVLERLAAPLDGAPQLIEARALLAVVDELELAVRGGDSEAVARVVEIACQVERLLRALAAELRP